jgi:hypothetical protein
MLMVVDHIAVLLKEIAPISDRLPAWLEREAAAEFPGEGTREQYLHLPGAACPSLLLMQAIAPGPYQRAFKKRGAGLHHIACRTSHLDASEELLLQEGLCLHPVSESSREIGVLWLYQRGLPFLLELVDSPELAQDASASSGRIAIPTARPFETVRVIPGWTIEEAAGPDLEIECGSSRLSIPLEA